MGELEVRELDDTRMLREGLGLLRVEKNQYNVSSLTAVGPKGALVTGAQLDDLPGESGALTGTVVPTAVGIVALLV